MIPHRDEKGYYFIKTFGAVGKDIQAAAGTFVSYHSVPTDKWWELLSVFREATTAATRVRLKLSGILVHITATATAESVSSTQWQLNPGDEIGIDTTGNAGDSNRGLELVVKEYYLYPLR